jgi:drug/metabolite transporter (DMT)-like permease
MCVSPEADQEIHEGESPTTAVPNREPASGTISTKQYWRGNALVLGSAVSFGLMPIFARLAYANHVNVRELLLVRFILAFLAMGALLLATRRLVVPDRNQLLILLALGGVGYFAQATFYFNSLLYIPVSVVSLILYTYPPFVTAGSLVLGWEKMSASLAVCLSLAVVGLGLVANPTGNVVLVGVLMALGASITYTIYILVSTKVLRNVSGEVASFYVMGAAALSFVLSNSLTGGISISWNFQAWIWVLLISVVSTIIAITTFFQGVKLIGPSRASILSSIEPATAIIAASILFAESLNTYQIAGGLLIVIAALLTAFSKRTQRH